MATRSAIEWPQPSDINLKKLDQVLEQTLKGPLSRTDRARPHWSVWFKRESNRAAEVRWLLTQGAEESKAAA